MSLSPTKKKQSVGDWWEWSVVGRKKKLLVGKLSSNVKLKAEKLIALFIVGEEGRGLCR
jgi:hypothetical protein|tara:strand:- start:379 stop:555 length:177 start_codon:yes stop_codon:yes gene_type:complete